MVASYQRVGQTLFCQTGGGRSRCFCLSLFHLFPLIRFASLDKAGGVGEGGQSGDWASEHGGRHCLGDNFIDHINVNYLERK